MYIYVNDVYNVTYLYPLQSQIIHMSYGLQNAGKIQHFFKVSFYLTNKFISTKNIDQNTKSWFLKNKYILHLQKKKKINKMDTYTN